MNCNCNNNHAIKPGIRHVFGNVLRVAIPLTLRTIELVDGEVEHTDTDFIPSSDYPVNVVFSKGAVKVSLKAEMRNGNVAYVEDRGTIAVGNYDITVKCFDDDGNPYRFNQNMVLSVVNATADAGIVAPIEYEVETWYLDAAIYLALKGEDGVGIADITTQSSGEIGGMNTVTIILTDGRTRTFSIMNGSGSVDNVLNIDSPSPIANSAVAAKFNEVDENFNKVFGSIRYDSESKMILFFPKGTIDKSKENAIATLDARPFVKDGMVNSAYISNNTLVITFNTDSGKEAIGVPLTSVFNPNNYYNKTQVDNLIGQKANTADVMAKVTYVNISDGLDRIKFSKIPNLVLDFIEVDDEQHEYSNGMFYGTSDGHVRYINGNGRIFDYGVVTHMAFVNADDNAWYRWAGDEWVMIGGRSIEDYSVSYLNGNLIFTSPDPTYDNGNLIFHGTTKPTYSNGNLIL